jgi:hypothetical protein
MGKRGLNILRQPINAIFRPSEIVDTPPTYDAGSSLRKIRLGATLLIFFIGNLLLYTLPLALAGIGAISTDLQPPIVFESLIPGFIEPNEAWLFLLRVTQNSLFLLTAAVITFVAFHISITITRSSKGIVRSLRVITYSSALYLATIFTLVWLASTNPNIGVADELLLSLQSEFIYYFIDLLDASLELPGGRTSRPNLSNLTTTGIAILSGLTITISYYAYMLYLGARKTHNTSRIESGFVVLFVAASPALYVIGSILIVELAITVPDLLFA